MRIYPHCIVALVTCASLLSYAAGTGWGREWTDSTGKFKFEGDLLAYDQETVILKRDKHQLVSIDFDSLSQADQEYLESQETQTALQEAEGNKQTWTLRSGLKVAGKVVDYVRKEVRIQRRRGKIYVNDRLFNNLPDVYQMMVPKIVAHMEELEIDGQKEFEAWVLKQKGAAVTFQCEGVLLEVENGDEYAVPFFFFSAEDLEVLEPGWKVWLAKAEAQEDRERQEKEQEMERMKLQSLAEAYQRDRQVERQISVMQLQMLAVAAGVVDLWEVSLFPGPNVSGSPLSVIVPARDSRSALQQALARYPGYVNGPARRVNRR